MYVVLLEVILSPVCLCFLLQRSKSDIKDDLTLLHLGGVRCAEAQATHLGQPARQ